MKKALITIVCLIMAQPLFAQNLGEKDFSSLGASTNQQLVQSAMEHALVTVTSAYLLEDPKSDSTFSREGRNDFNSIKSKGVRVKGGFIVLPQAQRPWDFDSAYSEYTGFKGVLSLIEIESHDSKIVLDSNMDISSCHSEGMLFFVTGDAKMDGLSLDPDTGAIDGWVVLSVVDKDGRQSLMVYRKTIDMRIPNNTIQIARPRISSTIECGMFVRAVNTSIGSVEFKLCGIVIDSGNEFTILRPNIVCHVGTNISAQAKAKSDTSDSRLKRKGLVPTKKSAKTEEKETSKPKKKKAQK